MTEKERLVASLRSAYVNLLKIQHSETRWNLQSTLCDLRDQISKHVNDTPENVQNWHEAFAWNKFVTINSFPFPLTLS